jgi:endonuclease III
MEKISEIIKLLKKEFPGLKPKPGKSNPLDVLIGTMLSQNTTDKTSFKAFMNIKNDIGSWEAVLQAPTAKLKKAVRVCGLAEQKSANIKKLLKTIKKEKGKLSLNYLKKLGDDEIYSELLRHKGIGYKTIACVMAFSLGRDVFPVDTHVHRLVNRLGLAYAKTPDKSFEMVKDKIPKGKKLLFHTLLIRFGRKICRAKNPLCGSCVLYDMCEYNNKESHFSGIKKPAVDNNFIILEHI